MIRFSIVIALLSIILIPVNSFASKYEGKFARPLMKTEEEMLLFFEEEEVLVSATLFPQKVAEAPAIASVIKEEEIRNMGARDIVDILNRIPGIHVTKGYYGKEEIEIRGIKTTNSEKVKFLIDGHSVNETHSGGAVWSFDSLTVDNVKRIEVIRGPGSALYGSNAFSAVINVITKDGKDIDGIQLSAYGGSFKTEKYNLQAGKKGENLEIAFSLDYFDTDGDELKIESDALGMSGKTHDFERKHDVGLKVKYKNLLFNSKYVKRKRGDYLGILYTAATNESVVNSEQYFGELSYSDRFFSESLRMTGKAYIDYVDVDAYWEMLPEGIGPYTEGMIGNPSYKNKTYGAELQLDYSITENNLITMGALKEKSKQFDVSSKANFDPTTCSPVGCAPTASGNFETVAPFNQEKTRNIWAVYVQDVWEVSDNINLTLGLRHDHYSDFGTTDNPRAGLVWNFSHNWDFKALYGTAFRAPSFEELYNVNNPSVVGNPDLDPEKITTHEFSLGHSYKDDTVARITYFNNMFKDKIQLVSNQFENTGGAKAQGIELEWKSSISKSISTYLNYTYQETEDEETKKRLSDIASHKGNIGFNLTLNHYLNLNTNIFLSGKRPRSSGDSRSASSGYELVDLTLITKDFIKKLELRASIHNLLDRDYEDPAPVGTVPNDFPREGRNYMFEVLYKF